MLFFRHKKMKKTVTPKKSGERNKDTHRQDNTRHCFHNEGTNVNQFNYTLVKNRFITQSLYMFASILFLLVVGAYILSHIYHSP